MFLVKRKVKIDFEEAMGDSGRTVCVSRGDGLANSRPSWNALRLTPAQKIAPLTPSAARAC
jgi:hypothetical protein